MMLLLLLVFVVTVQAILDFSRYPQCAQPILHELAPEECEASNLGYKEIQKSNICLCEYHGFPTDAAEKIGSKCSCQDLAAFAQTFTDLCSYTRTASVLGVQDLMEIGNHGDASCEKEPPLDNGDIIAIAFGVATVILGALQTAVSCGWIKNNKWGPLTWIRSLWALLPCT